MIIDYSYRAYRDGDAEGINSLYEKVTGQRRTIAQFEWQWLAAPGGKAEIWLIEAVHKDGTKELIGHHGVMPVRFSLGSENLLFGKTENTLVLPEFRRKILYPRFEKRFLNHYEPRFDALFSTIGPPAAIRQRKALGYQFPSKFVNYKFGTGSTSEFSYLWSRSARFFHRRDNRAGHLPYGFETDQWPVLESSASTLRMLDDTTATSDPFFETFWSGVRGAYGITPRRDAEDLNWRFWSNPYKKHVVIVNDGEDSEPGYAILSRSLNDPGSADIEDIVPSTPDPHCFARLLISVLRRLRKTPIQWVSLWTTDEACQQGGIASELESHVLRAYAYERRIRPFADNYMPRRLTTSGVARGISSTGWYITPITFQGRVAV